METMKVKCKGCGYKLSHSVEIKILPDGTKRHEIKFPSEVNGCPKCGNIEYTFEEFEINCE